MKYAIEVIVAEEIGNAVELQLDRDGSAFVDSLADDLLVVEDRAALGLLTLFGAELLGNTSYDYVCAMISESRGWATPAYLRIKILKGLSHAA